MAYVKSNVTRPDGNPGRGITPHYMLTVIDVEDIKTFPARDEAGVVIADDIEMNAAATPVKLYLTPGTVEIVSNTEGEADAMGFKPSVKGNHPGNKQAVREFKTNWLGRKCVVILSYCDGGDADLIGSPCNPAQMSANYTGNKDTSSTEFIFEQISNGDDVAIYQGAIPGDAVAAAE